MNGVLVVDKPEGPTSHDVVAKARRALGTRAVGHAGTLDPMATGVLVLAVGQATKLVQYLTAADKAYEATLALGEETDTLDAMGQVTARAEVPLDLSREAVQEAANRFLGTHVQRAPVVSAIKVGGERLHARTRRGERVDAPEREVTLHEVRIQQVRGSAVELALQCAKGFYVRAFGRDLARALGTVGHLTALRRTRSGPFRVEDAVPFEWLLAGDEAQRTRLRARLLSLEEAAAELLRVELTEAGTRDAAHGRPIGAEGVGGEWIPEVGEEEVLALFSPAGRLVALGRRHGGRIQVVRGFPRDDGG